MNFRNYLVGDSKMRQLYLALIACVMMMVIPYAGHSQGKFIVEVGKRALKAATLFAVEEVTQYGLESIVEGIKNRSYANPIRVVVYNPYPYTSTLYVTQDNRQWYPLSLPPGYYVLLQTDYYPYIAFTTKQGNYYYLNRSGSYAVPYTSYY